jgi:hypothetical protein
MNTDRDSHGKHEHHTKSRSLNSKRFGLQEIRGNLSGIIFFIELWVLQTLKGTILLANQGSKIKHRNLILQSYTHSSNIFIEPVFVSSFRVCLDLCCMLVAFSWSICSLIGKSRPLIKLGIGDFDCALGIPDPQ